MKKGLTTLNRIFKYTRLNESNFYSITFTEFRLNLQGTYSSKLLKDLKDLDFTISATNTNGYIKAVKGLIEVVLTD